MEKAYIIILNYNGWQDTIECLESVYQSDYRNYQVIVCDNASTDGSLEKIKEWAQGTRTINCPEGKTIGSYVCRYKNKPLNYTEIRRKDIEAGFLPDVAEGNLILVASNENLGFSGGNNLGLKYALKKEDFKYIWVLNNDTVVDNHALSALIEKQIKTEGCGAVGSVLCYYTRPNEVQCVGGTLNIETFSTESVGERILLQEVEDDAPIELLAGASFLMSQDFIYSVGIMDEAYFLYYEEIELATRAGKKGWCLSYAKDSVVYHKGGVTTGKTSTSNKDYHLVRSQIIFVRRYYSSELSRVIERYNILIRKRLSHLHFKRAWAVYKGIQDGLAFESEKRLEQ